MTPVYFDHNATTPIDPRVQSEMLPWLGERHGNPSSVHGFGRDAREAVEAARERVAGLLGASPVDLVLTASGTEANNAVILSSARAAGGRGHLLISALEHPSVTAAAARLEEEGVEVTRVSPSRQGRVEAGEVLAELRDDTFLVCLMLANNEIGTLQPVAEVAAGCRERGVPVLCDAVQAIGKIGVDAAELQVDYLTLGAHKFYGPLGAAALWIRSGAPFSSLLVGGSQERRRRAGTVNVPAVVGMGRAAELAAAELDRRQAQMRTLRDRFESGLEEIPEVEVHGAGVPRLPNTSHICLRGVDAEALMIRLDLEGYAVSTGSACASGAVEASPTLVAMGLSTEEGLSSLRVSFGTTNSAAQVDDFLSILAEETATLRRLSAAR